MPKPKTSKQVAVIGSGPAALMVADIVSKSGHSVTLFEKRKAAGRKLLIAGSSGLNISNSLPISEFVKHYTGSEILWKGLIQDFSPRNWIQFIEALGLPTFEGTSGRYFVRDMKASKLLQTWLKRLEAQGVNFKFGMEFGGFEKSQEEGKWNLHFTNSPGDVLSSFDAVCFCLGGGSYEPQETPVKWPRAFIEKGIRFLPYTPSNVGYQVAWKAEFLKEADGLPLKNIRLTSSRGSKKGDAVITQYGLEGTPVYFLGEEGEVKLDLKPDLSVEQILVKCKTVKENLSPMRRVKKVLSLCPGSLALLFHHAPRSALNNLDQLATLIKSFPVTFKGSQKIEEAISSAGGIEMSELDEQMMFKNFPGLFAAGEMLNWDAPTGGFLIQGCVSQGYRAGNSIAKFVRDATKYPD